MGIKKSDLNFNVENLQVKQEISEIEQQKENESDEIASYLAKFKKSDLFRYKKFCLKQRISFRKLIEISVDYFVRQSEDEKIVLTPSGVFEKK